jgi:hypothetical protein
MRTRWPAIAAALVFAVGAMGAAGAAQADCDRQCLAGVMETYLAALLKHDASALPVTRNIKYTENGVRINLGDGLWRTASAPPTYRLDVIDEEAGQVGLLGRIKESDNNNWFAVRLKVEPDHAVSEIEALINRSASGGGGSPLAASKVNTEPNPLMAQVIPPAKRTSRAELAAAGNAYFSAIDELDSPKGVPFSPQCQRRENGTVTANNPDAPQGSMQWMDCKTQLDTGFSVIVTDVRERRFAVVDRTKGLAFGWGYFDHNGSIATFTHTLDHSPAPVPSSFRQPISFYIAEVFKVVDGQIRQIEAVLTTVPYGMASSW